MKFEFYQWLANKLPKKLIYFSYIRLHAHATCTKYSDRHPDEVNWREALEAWGVETNTAVAKLRLAIESQPVKDEK
jgi:hypothetical protein